MATRKYHRKSNRKSNKRFRKTRSKRQRGGESHPDDETQPDGEETQDKKLLKAVMENKFDDVKKALDNGADVNAKDIDGWTALIWASENGHTKIVEMLLDKGADVNAISGSSISALHFASNQGHIDIVKMLLDKGAKVDAKTNSRNTALIWASEKGHKEVVEMLLDKGADVNAKDNDGKTALILASVNGDKEIVTMLLDKGADVNSKDDDGDTALILASLNGHKEIVTMLLKKGADVNTTDEEGETALIVASLKGHTEIVVMLLDNGADVNTKNEDGETALQVATLKGHTKIVELLKKAMVIKEENFIVDKFCKEATETTYFDPNEGGEVTRDIQEYLQEDKDNIMLIYKSNKADLDLEYFGTTRTIITNAFKDKINLFFGCNKIAEIARVPPESEFNKNDIYFKLNKIGLVGTSSEYCDIKTLLENKEHQLFAIKNLDKKYPSFVSHNVLYGEDRRRLVSGSHCQGGDSASVSTLIKAYPKNEEFPEISNSNMLQETTRTQPSPPPVQQLQQQTLPPPPPATLPRQHGMGNLGGSNRTKKNKRKTRKTRKTKKSNKKFRKTRSKRQKGGTPPSPPSIEYMIDAIEEDEEEQVKHLLEMGADVNATEPSSGNTPLIEASAFKLPKIVKMLLEKRADVNVKNKKGNTALMEAINCDWVDPEFDKSWYLVEYDITEIMEMLLAAGADVNVVNDDGKTALDIAKKTECSKKIQSPLKRHNIEQFIPRHLQTQQDRKKDRIKLTWALREKDVGNRGDGTMPYELRHEIGKYLGGGKRRTRKSKKSKRKTKKH